MLALVIMLDQVRQASHHITSHHITSHHPHHSFHAYCTPARRSAMHLTQSRATLSSGPSSVMCVHASSHHITSHRRQLLRALSNEHLFYICLALSRQEDVQVMVAGHNFGCLY